ncbi:fatty acid desaturase family protein [Thalassospira sp. SM2505]
MIDKKFFAVSPGIYFRDLLIAMAMFLGGLICAIQASGVLFVAGYLLCVIGLHRAGIFGHELAHRPNSKPLRVFYWFWHVTIGCIIMVPSARFSQPHKIHHQTGTFRTEKDPQYLLVRSDPKLAVFVLLVLPFATPLYVVFQTIITSIGGMQLEEWIDRFSQKHLNFSTSTPVPDAKKNEVVWLSRLSLLYLIALVWLLPQFVGFVYAVLVGAWLLIVLRIPLEHELEIHAETSSPDDQMYDSFTVESPIAVIIQPIGFRYHTAHHMYPGVPYHNLPALHQHLKATIPAYNNSVVSSYWELIKGPKYQKKQFQEQEQKV